jgi:hypothetical protein
MELFANPTVQRDFKFWRTTITFLVHLAVGYASVVRWDEGQNEGPLNCQVCEDLRSDGSGKDPWQGRSVSEVEAGAEAGFNYCLLISKDIRAYVPQNELTDEFWLRIWGPTFARQIPKILQAALASLLRIILPARGQTNTSNKSLALL